MEAYHWEPKVGASWNSLCDASQMSVFPLIAAVLGGNEGSGQAQAASTSPMFAILWGNSHPPRCPSDQR